MRKNTSSVSLAFIILISLFSSFSFAASTQESMENTIDKQLGLQDSINRASIEMSSFFYDVQKSDILIITGSKISVEDKMIFRIIQSHLGAGSFATMTDIEALNNSAIYGKTIILLGSDRTNYISKEVSDKGFLDNSNQSEYDPLKVEYGISDSGKKMLIVYSQKEIKNNENRAVKNSPLNNFMDEKYVPAAATLISVFLLYLWTIVGDALVSLVSDYISSKIADKATKNKKISEKKKQHHEKKLRVHQLMHMHEVIALVFSIIVFALTLAWTWTNNMSNFWNMFLISIIIVAILSIMKEYIRQNFCYERKVSTEYLLWPFGALVTVVSTYLGNTFSLVSYGLVDDTDEDEKKFGKISFLTSLFTLLISIFAYIANIIYPSLLLQMIFVYAIMSTFIDMFPMSPMGGADVRKWNFPVWLVMYIVIIACYIFMNFTSYI
ncbi:MAG TPA: hypothetical protein VEC16_07025 [Alphaproteobacteria bacterium]|nr:hypothetical protein [Alphaproteobacteria bacterium]